MALIHVADRVNQTEHLFAYRRRRQCENSICAPRRVADQRSSVLWIFGDGVAKLGLDADYVGVPCCHGAKWGCRS
jgi:hypothetical protein